MSSKDLAVSVRGLSKSYIIAHNSERPTNLREAIVDRFRHPLGNGGQDHEMFWAIKNMDFDIRSGEVVGIIGRNGAGKSTLLKILSRITWPTTGEIDIHGRVSSLLEVGTGFHAELTGRENIALNGSILGMSRRDIKNKFDEIVAFAEVENFLDTPVKRYSSGMYMRLAFAVAAHLESQILIIDEVLAVGDFAFQKKCLGKMQEVAGRGRTVLFVSHNLTAVRSLCNRVIWLKDGLVNWDGEVGPAIDEYLTEDLGGDTNSFDLDRVQRTCLEETSVRVRNVTINGGEQVRHGEPMTIEIQYRSNRAVEEVAFGIAFSSPEGGRVMCVDSDIPSGNRFDIPAHCKGRVILSIPENLLQPSRYFVTVAARSGDNHGLDYLPTFTQIEVLHGPKTPAILVGRNEGGCVRMPSTFTHSHPSVPSDETGQRHPVTVLQSR